MGQDCQNGPRRDATMKSPDELRPASVDLPGESTGLAGSVETDPAWKKKFDEELATDIAFERSILNREVWVILAIVCFVVIREFLL